MENSRRAMVLLTEGRTVTFWRLPTFMLLSTMATTLLADEVELYPQYFTLRLGEVIHYTPISVGPAGQREFLRDYEFSTGDSRRLRLVSPTGVFEGLVPGPATVMLRAGGIQHRFEAMVLSKTLPLMKTVPCEQVPRIASDKVMLVGHANRDGFDHTMAAKPGIDHWVGQFKRENRPVVYLVSADYPNWYTEDRNPAYAVISEGQEHNLRLDADAIYFCGGAFEYCLLRNVQFVLHRFLSESESESIRLVFPTEGIWTGAKSGPYPAPMTTLDTLFRRAASPRARYEQFVVPFLNRLSDDYPVLGYPRPEVTPSPHLKTLLSDVTIRVSIDGEFETEFRSGQGRLIRMDFVQKKIPDD